MIEFYLDRHDGNSPYAQLVRQVKQALVLDILHVGDQLPTVKEVVGKLAINPNTVLKAYRELEHEGLVASRPGVGTFIVQTLAGAGVDQHPHLRARLSAWIADAHAAGLDNDGINALFAAEMRSTFAEARV